MSELAAKKCLPCEGGVPPLGKEQASALLAQLSGWEIVENHHLNKTYRFKNFQQALDFANRVAAIAEEEAHHPDILISWGRAEITLWTHAAGGLTENDFILAAKIDQTEASR